MRLLKTVPLLLLSLVLLTGCVPPFFACTAIGYGSVARIELLEPRPGLELALCEGENCTPGPVEMPIEVGATETPTPTGVFELTGDSVSGWSASLNSGHAVLGYRLTGEDGAVVAEGVTEADWVRIDGTEQCGGNRLAEIQLSL
jgi:hypothetical protein